jgi:exopolyphosphatase / guanosine-5'-triphosphate,3'-diphosphate pyrophosphatase
VCLIIRTEARVLKISVIDLGFNSAKLVNYYVEKDHSYTAYSQEGVTVRLGEGLDESGFLNKAAICRAIDALRLFRDIVKFESVDHVLAVTTSAVREATNKDDFLAEVYQKTGFRLRVLSGKEESLYSYGGALRSICLHTTLFFDLGGGSLEMVYSENFKIKKVMSLPLGALRLSQIFKNYDDDNNSRKLFTKKNYDRLEQYISRELPDRKELDLSSDTALVGVGGTLRAIARYDQDFHHYILDKIHNYHLYYESIDLINKKLNKMTPDEIAEIDAVGNNRAETVAAGSCTIKLLMQKFGFNEVIVSDHGLREGILLSFLESPQEYSKQNINQNKIQKYVQVNCKLEMAKRSRDMILPLVSHGIIKQKEQVILSLAMKQISKMAATSSPYNLFHMLLDQDIAYLTHSEQLILALSIMHTKKSKIANWLFKRYDQILRSQDKKTIERTSACLVILSILERNKCTIKLTFYNEKKIIIAIMLDDDDNGKFPEMLFSNAVKNFESTFNVDVDFSVSYRSNRITTATSTTTAMGRELHEKPNSPIMSINKRP